MRTPMKSTAALLVILLLGLAICWAAGLVEFTYANVVSNEPLLHPRKVKQFNGTNMVLESGEIIALLPRYSSERSAEEIYADLSNQVSRSDFEVDLQPTKGDRVGIYVRRLRKFRDSAPPFTIPIIRQTVGRKYRQQIALGIYVTANGQNGVANGSQSIRSDTNRTPATTDSLRPP